jgi:integrase
MQKFRLIRRRTGVYYAVDRLTRVQASLKTKDHEAALRLLNAKNESHHEPLINLQIARAYLVAADASMVTRTWSDAFDEIIKLKSGPTKDRWIRASNDKAFSFLKGMRILETRAKHFLDILECKKPATNAFLRKLHNFCLDVGFLPVAVLPKKQWPQIHYKEKRAITWDEHLKVIDGESNRQKRAYYELLWHLGGSQTDVANLRSDYIDWDDRVIAFRRKKTGTPSLVRFGPSVESILKHLPTQGFLFPRLQTLNESRRADYFRKRCQMVGVSGVSLHSYRHAFAERCRVSGVPERAAMEMLGHSSKAVHRAYARRAKFVIAGLESYERKANETEKLAPM